MITTKHFFCNSISQQYLVDLSHAHALSSGWDPNLSSALLSGRRVLAGPLECHVAFAAAEQSLPPGSLFPPMERPRAGLPSVSEGPIWIEFELPPTRYSLMPPMAAAGGRLGALFVPNVGGGVAFGCITMQTNNGAGGGTVLLLMPFPIQWTSHDETGLFVVEKHPGEIGKLAMTSLRVCALATEILRAERFGLLTPTPGPDLSRESRRRARGGKPELLACDILALTSEEDGQTPLSTDILGWCAICQEPGAPEILPIRQLLITARTTAFDAERVAVARWALNNPDLSRAQAMSAELLQGAAHSSSQRLALVSRIATSSGKNNFAIVQKGSTPEVVGYNPARDGDEAEAGRENFYQWAAALTAA